MTPRQGLRTDLGLMPCEDALALQRRIVAAKIRDRGAPDVFLLLEHPPVFTLGRRGGREFLRVSEDFLEERGVAVIPAERGGSITYHGPGQLVCYPIVDLKRAGLGPADLVDRLEQVMIDTARAFGVPAERRPKNRGVWVQDRKLGSVGVAVRHGVSFHGFALNIALSLEPFGWISPCGLPEVVMTSLARESAGPASMEPARRTAAACIETVFGLRLTAVAPDVLENRLPFEPAEALTGGSP